MKGEPGFDSIEDMAKKKSGSRSRKKSTKKASKKKKTSSKTKLRWEDECIENMQSIVKQSKTSKAALMVFSTSGDLVFQSGMKTSQDFTSLGALLAGVQGAKIQLDKMLGLQTALMAAGEGKQVYWVEHLNDWMILGLRIPRSARLQNFYKLLKKNKLQDARVNVSEALDGLAGAAVDAAFGNN